MIKKDVLKVLVCLNIPLQTVGYNSEIARCCDARETAHAQHAMQCDVPVRRDLQNYAEEKKGVDNSTFGSSSSRYTYAFVGSLVLGSGPPSSPPSP